MVDEYQDTNELQINFKNFGKWT